MVSDGACHAIFYTEFITEIIFVCTIRSCVHEALGIKATGWSVTATVF